MCSVLRVLAAAVGGVSGFYVEMPAAIRLLAVLMAVEYLSAWGAFRTARETPKALRDRTGLPGLTRKALIAGIVLASTLVDQLLGADVCTGAVTLYYTANEALCILQNAALLGVPVPQRLVSLLGDARKRIGAPRDASVSAPRGASAQADAPAPTDGKQNEKNIPNRD